MHTMGLETAISRTSYPGRGILIGLSDDAQRAVIAYFIMGRSENSRNRIFVSDGEGIRTQAHDPAKMKDPSLVIYAPVRMFGDQLIVTNGDQTDTIVDALTKGKTFEDALRTRTFEPDPPNYTPRISGIAMRNAGRLRYILSILKSADGDPSSSRRQFFDYEHPVAGQAHFIHTYAEDGDPLPSFDGEPEQIALCGHDDVDSLAETIWASLDAENKVSLFTRTIELATGEMKTRIINKHQ